VVAELHATTEGVTILTKGHRSLACSPRKTKQVEFALATRLPS